MPSSRKRKRNAELSSDDDYEEASSKLKPSQSLPNISTQQLTNAIEKSSRKSKAQDLSYIAEFKAKLEQDREELDTAIDSIAAERRKQVETRRNAAVQLLACVKPSTDVTKDGTYLPSYLEDAKKTCLELSSFCREIITIYKNIVDAVAKNATDLGSENHDVDDLKRMQRLLRTGTKHTLSEVDGLLGTDDLLDTDHVDSVFDIDAVTPEDLVEWKELQVASHGNDLSAAPTKQETFDERTKKLAKYANRLLRGVDEVD